MNWTFLLTLYGTPPEGPNPIIQYLGANATHVLIGGAEEHAGYRLHDGDIPALVQTHQPSPFTHYVFASGPPDELVVANRGKTFFSFFTGTLADNEPASTVLKQMLNLNRGTVPPQGTTYTELLEQRVMSHLHGKFSMVIAELGVQPTFIFRGQKLPFKAWLIAYSGMYYMMVSNVENVADQIEDMILTGDDPAKESYFQQNLEVPAETMLVFRPVYAITKFRTRIKSYVDKSARKLLIANYFRRYVCRQCSPNQ